MAGVQIIQRPHARLQITHVFGVARHQLQMRRRSPWAAMLRPPPHSLHVGTDRFTNRWRCVAGVLARCRKPMPTVHPNGSPTTPELALGPARIAARRVLCL
jgi:hypothetical protein